MKIKVIYNVSLMPMYGVVIYPFVLLKVPKPLNDNSKEMYLARILLRHELIHVEQIRREIFPLFFYVKFAMSTISNLLRGLPYKQAYYQNKFEVEAYARQYEKLSTSELAEVNEPWFV